MWKQPLYESWSLPELKTELRKRNAKVSGRKKELIERLEFYDKNSTARDIQEPEYRIILPSTEHYKDAHEEMVNAFPRITMERLTDYLSQYQKYFDVKCRDMYNERYLRCFRVCPVPDRNLTFISSLVWAEMKKSVSYKVDFSVDNDGVVQEAQCECGAGQGPSAHCKHVATVLYASIKFKENRTVISEITCTQVLQTFHQAKPHKGSPLKASNLQSIRRDERQLQYDPRPYQYRSQESYPDYFKNTCLNYEGSKRMPVRQLYPPANIPGLSHDHDYMADTMEEHFLKIENITVISEEKIHEIEIKTRNQASSQQWRDERAKRITASMFGTICKATMRRDRDGLARSICKQKSVRTCATLYGVRYESVAVEKFEKLGMETKKCGLFISKEYPFLAATPDRIINEHTLLEVKCPYSCRDKEVTAENVSYLRETEDGLTLDTNHDYYYQIQGQLMCAGRKECKLVVYTKKDMKVITIKYDPVLISNMILKLSSFFNDHFKSALVQYHFYKNYNDYTF